MKKTTSSASPRRRSRSRDQWERQWQEHWSKIGQPGYELPVGGGGGDEREFLATARTVAGERDRLNRINEEFLRAFKALYPVGPAVTVLGSARFKENHPYYRLARAVGGELVEGQKLVSIHGEKVAVRARVHTLGGFSAHAGQTDLLAWFGALAPAKPRVVVIHGEDDQRAALAKKIQQQYHLRSTLPKMGDVVEF